MIDWQPWDAEAFACAARERKPVLLAITAAWCRACREMDASTYADPAVAACVADRFVAVRVDSDRRPDINDRYNLGGWPTTAFLDADGQLLTGGTWVARDRMLEVLARVADACATISSSIRPALEKEVVVRASPLDVAAITAQVFESFDAAHGGFADEPKFPHTAPLRLALALHRDDPSGPWQSIVERTLDATADGALRDPVSGGYFRYCASRDWRQASPELLLETNAALLLVFTEAALLLGRDADAARARAVAEFITTRLRIDGGGYAGSDADRVLYADANAHAVSALLAASAAFDDRPSAETALASFERVILACYKPGLGVAHLFDGKAQVRGLLSDQAACVIALLDAHQVTGDEPYLMLAQELALTMLHHLQDEPDGGFFDRLSDPADVGLLRQPRKPFAANSEAALAFGRLAAAPGVEAPSMFAHASLRALATAAAQLDGQGPAAAVYLLAERQLAQMIDFRTDSDA